MGQSFSAQSPTASLQFVHKEPIRGVIILSYLAYVPQVRYFDKLDDVHLVLQDSKAKSNNCAPGEAVVLSPGGVRIGTPAKTQKTLTRVAEFLTEHARIEIQKEKGFEGFFAEQGTGSALTRTWSTSGEGRQAPNLAMKWSSYPSRKARSQVVSVSVLSGRFVSVVRTPKEWEEHVWPQGLRVGRLSIESHWQVQLLVFVEIGDPRNRNSTVNGRSVCRIVRQQAWVCRRG